MMEMPVSTFSIYRGGLDKVFAPATPVVVDQMARTGGVPIARAEIHMNVKFNKVFHLRDTGEFIRDRRIDATEDRRQTLDVHQNFILFPSWRIKVVYNLDPFAIDKSGFDFVGRLLPQFRSDDGGHSSSRGHSERTKFRKSVKDRYSDRWSIVSYGRKFFSDVNTGGSRLPPRRRDIFHLRELFIVLGSTCFASCRTKCANTTYDLLNRCLNLYPITIDKCKQWNMSVTHARCSKTCCEQWWHFIFLILCERDCAMLCKKKPGITQIFSRLQNSPLPIHKFAIRRGNSSALSLKITRNICSS